MSGAVKHLSFAVSLIILISLGSWQLYRLSYKEKIIEEIMAKSEADPLDNITEHNLPYYQKINATVVIDNSKPIYLYHIQNGQAGYLLFYPALIEQRYILINTGFITEKKHQPHPPLITLDHATILPFPKKNIFTPNNEPSHNQWYYFDQKQLGNYLERSVLTSYIQLQSYHPQIVNNHLQYAITWYLLALSLALIYALHLKRDNKISHEQVNYPS